MRRKSIVFSAIALTLVAGNAFASRSTDPEPVTQSTVYTANNSYGVSDLVETDSDTSLNQTYNYVSPSGHPITVNVSFTGGSWSFTDGIDTLSFQKTSSGFTVMRRKTGYAATNIAHMDNAGTLVSETNNLTASVSSQFSDSLSWLHSHFQSDPVALHESSKAREPGSFSCRGAAVIGGLAIVSESILYGITWVSSGGVIGIIATPIYIITVSQTTAWTLNNCKGDLGGGA